MAIVYRTTGAWGSGKGSNLTPAEVDGNFHDLDGRLDTLEGSPPTPNNIANMTVTDGQLTITLDDATAFGPFTLPIAAFRWRGDWVAGTAYKYYDVVYVSGEGVFVVGIAHTAPGAFTDGHIVSGTVAYQKVMDDLQPPVMKIISSETVTERTLYPADAGKLIRLSQTTSGVITVDIDPAHASDWELGTTIELVQADTTPLFIDPPSGVTVNAKAGCTFQTTEQWAVLTLVYVAEDTWDLFGDYVIGSV